MPALARPAHGIVKPGEWNVSPAFVAPEWRWAWRDLRGVVPMWEGGGPPSLINPSVLESLALQTGVTWSRGPEGAALDFDDASDAFLQDTSTYDWTEPFTVLGLMSFDDLSADHAMGGSDGDSVWTWQCWMDTGNTQFGIATRTDASVIQAEYGGSPNTTDRFLVGISFDGTDAWKLWVDGVNAANITESDPDTDLQELNIGAANGTGQKQHDGRYFVNYHWGRELSAIEHKQLARDPFGPFRMARTRPVFVAAAGTTKTVSLSDQMDASDALDVNRVWTMDL